jgi:hypothetical protein
MKGVQVWDFVPWGRQTLSFPGKAAHGPRDSLVHSSSQLPSMSWMNFSELQVSSAWHNSLMERCAFITIVSQSPSNLNSLIVLAIKITPCSPWNTTINGLLTLSVSLRSLDLRTNVHSFSFFLNSSHNLRNVHQLLPWTAREFIFGNLVMEHFLV